MWQHRFHGIEKQSDQALMESLKKLIRDERKGQCTSIILLMEIKKRRLALQLGYRSLFSFCEEVLMMAPGTIAARMQVASRCVQYPELLEEILSGKLSLSTAAKIAPYLSKSNAKTMITSCRGKTVRQVETILVELRFKEVRPVTAGATRIAEGKEAKAAVKIEPCAPQLPLPVADVLKDEAVSDGAGQPVRAPVGFNFRFSGSQGFKDKLNRLANILGNENPSQDLERILSIALDDALNKRDPARRQSRRKARRDARKKTRSKEKAPPKAVRRNVPRAHYDQVFERSGRRCEYQSKTGRRCDQTARLQIDHIRPWGMGGGHDLANLRVLCQAHNLLKMSRDYSAS